jgi:cardiolipin synthase
MYRDHRKFLIIDGKHHLRVGGMNLNYISIRGSRRRPAGETACMSFTLPPWQQPCSITSSNGGNEQSWETIERDDFAVDFQAADGLKAYDAFYLDQHPKSKKIGQLFGSLINEARHEIKVLPSCLYGQAYDRVLPAGPGEGSGTSK